MSKTATNEKKRNFIYKYELEIVSIILIIIYLRTVINYDSISFTQFATGIFAWLILLHEWEETRYPWWFFEMFWNRAWINISNLDMWKCHLPIKIFILLSAIVPLFFDNCMPIVFVPVSLMLFEWIIHPIWIKLNNIKQCYTPWMYTATIMLIYGIYVSYHLISIWEASRWDLLRWFIICFGTFFMFASIMFKLMNTKISDIRKNYMKNRKKQLDLDELYK